MAKEGKAPAGRLYWRCRRGTKELDRVLGDYLEQEYTRAGVELQNAFAGLLEQQDPDIYDWLMGTKLAETEFRAIIEALQIKYIRQEKQ